MGQSTSVVPYSGETAIWKQSFSFPNPLFGLEEQGQPTRPLFPGRSLTGYVDYDKCVSLPHVHLRPRAATPRAVLMFEPGSLGSSQPLSWSRPDLQVQLQGPSLLQAEQRRRGPLRPHGKLAA